MTCTCCSRERLKDTILPDGRPACNLCATEYYASLVAFAGITRRVRDNAPPDTSRIPRSVIESFNTFMREAEHAQGETV